MSNFDNLKPVPASPSLVLYADPAGLLAAKEYKFIPKNQDGSVFDCTALQTTEMTVSNMLADPNPVAIKKTIAPDTKDATGFVLTLTSTQADFLQAGTNARYSIVGVDGSASRALLATGSISFSIVPVAG